MNYYDEILKKINSLIKNNPNDALKLIESELNVPYIPKDFFDSLIKLKNEINLDSNHDFKLDIETIKSYLYDNEDKQNIAVNELIKLNLRDYEDIISDYLLSDGYIKAKIDLIIGLRKQESSRTFSILKDNKIYQFIPKDIVLPEDSEYIKDSLKILDDYYMKNPDKLVLSKELLYNDYLLNLPNIREKNDIKYITLKIKKYIDESFDTI